MAVSLPTQARVVIVGGGVVGCSVAWIKAGKYAVDIAGDVVPATLLPAPAFAA